MVKSMLRSAAASDPGRVRQNNEDAYWTDPGRGIFLVVDGIGGQAAGEKAAAIAVERIRARLERPAGSTEQRIREAITLANNEILRAAKSNTEWAGMACVLTLAVMDNGSVVVGHVGDSRLYLLGRGSIRKVTHDHSPVGEREDAGELKERDAMRHPRRNEVFRDVGSQEHSPDDADFIEVQRVPFDAGQALVLCSDGLSDLVTSGEILEAVERNADDAEAAVRALIAKANSAGGKDNVTVVVVAGEEFRGMSVSAPRASSSGWGMGVLLFAAGLVVATAGAYFTRAQWVAPPVVIVPRVIAATGSIAAAMAQARPGDTVEVPPGEYREQVRLKDGVTLRARSPRDATLRAAPFGDGAAVLAEGVKGARLSGFRILADSAMPIPVGVLLRDAQVEIDDVEIKGAGVGIEVRGSGSPALRANSIRDCGAEGILVQAPASPWISHNLLQGNKGIAIAVREGAKPVLLENQEVRK